MIRIICTVSIFCFATLAHAQTNLHAWHTNGQTWLVWSDTQPQPAPQTYDLYVRGALSTNLALWTPIGRVLQQDWQARRLRNYTPATQWQIPTAGGPYYRLATNEALFVSTPHAAATQYFAVVRHGQVALSTNNVVGPIAQPMTQPVTCHPQLSGTNTSTNPDQSYTDYALWLDGRADWTNSRPDIPVLGNASFNGVASLFRVYQPTVSQPPGAAQTSASSTGAAPISAPASSCSITAFNRNQRTARTKQSIRSSWTRTSITSGPDARTVGCSNKRRWARSPATRLSPASRI